MKCPFCNNYDTKVNDSRPADDFGKIRRRRECLRCGKRFTTYEVVETAPIIVVKKDGSREAFNRNKLVNGLLRACEKRPISTEILEEVVDSIEQKILNSLDREVTTSHIGDLILGELRDIDDVAYVRFASVYKDFKDIESFMKELAALQKQ